MTDHTRTFAVASDEALIGMIEGARERLVVIAPAVTAPVAEALARRFADLPRLALTVILDSDPEVYRLGFGDPEALEAIRAAAAAAMFDLREQPGVRIGVVIADETTMIFAPVSRNIEAGSTSVEKPNAILLGGPAGGPIAAAAGAEPGEAASRQEVGRQALTPAQVASMQANLQANPPTPIDIARKLHVFSSKVQYVEFSVSNYRLTTRQIALPPELVDVSDPDLKDRITSRIRAPFDGVGRVEVVLREDGRAESLKVDDDWLRRERKRIEDDYTFQINNFGRVILSSDRAAFDAEVKRFEAIIRAYQAALSARLAERRGEFESRIVQEFAPRWMENPPGHFDRWGLPITPASIVETLRSLAGEIFEGAIKFEAPNVRTVYKNIAPENISRPEFLEVLKGIMMKRRVPRQIIGSLFETGQAAPEKGAFL